VSFFAIEHRRNDPDQKNRSGDEVEEILCDGFAGEIGYPRTHSNEPLKNEKEWKRNRNGNVESAKPATAEQRECGCDERQERKSPNGCCSAETGQGRSHDGKTKGRDEGESVAVANSTNECRKGEVRHWRYLDACTFSPKELARNAYREIVFFALQVSTSR